MIKTRGLIVDSPQLLSIAIAHNLMLTSKVLNLVLTQFKSIGPFFQSTFHQQLALVTSHLRVPQLFQSWMSSSQRVSVSQIHMKNMSAMNLVWKRIRFKLSWYLGSRVSSCAIQNKGWQIQLQWRCPSQFLFTVESKSYQNS